MLTSSIKSLFNFEVQSIRDNKEKALIFCHNQVHEISSKWKNGLLKAQLNVSDIRQKCGEEKPLFIHTHMLHPSDPSDEDFEGYDTDIFNGFCVAGIEGVQCYDNEKKQTFQKDWREEMAKQFSRFGMHWKGRNLFCDHIGKDYYCELNGNQNSQKMGIFNKISTKGGKLVFKSGEADVTLQTRKGESMDCFGKRDGSELSCVVSND